MKTTSIRIIGAIAVAIGIAAAAVAWMSTGSEGHTGAIVERPTSESVDRSTATTTAARPVSTSRSTPSSPQHQAEQRGNAESDDAWVGEYGCATCDLGFAVPRSRDEALWLARQGFPSRSQRLQATTLSIDQLRIRAAAGDLVAAGLYADRLREERNVGAVSAYEEAAMMGSVYALYRLADYYRDRGPSLFFQYQQAAYLRIAGIRGDYRATGELRQRFPQFSIGDIEIADRQAAVLLSNWHSQRASRGWPELTISPRPNARQSDAEAVASRE